MRKNTEGHNAPLFSNVILPATQEAYAAQKANQPEPEAGSSLLGCVALLLLAGAAYLAGTWAWENWNETHPSTTPHLVSGAPSPPATARATVVQQKPIAQELEPPPPTLSPQKAEAAPAERKLSPQMEAWGEMIATAVNLNGFLCAKVVDVRPLKVNDDTFEVTCIEYRGGTGKVTYILNSETGVAFRQ